MLRTPEKGSFQHGRGLETQRVRPPGVAMLRVQRKTTFHFRDQMVEHFRSVVA